MALVLAGAGQALAFDIIPCKDRRPGTPNQERAVATSPTSIDVSWQNTADESEVWFDLDGMGQNDSINNFGGFTGTFHQRITKTITGLTTGRQYCYRIWSRVDEANGCRSDLPSAMTCATPTATSSGSSNGSTPGAGAGAAKPVLSLATPSANTFALTGKGFLPSHTVHVRAVDDQLTTRYFDQADDGKGQMSLTLSNLCMNSGSVHFSANDGRPTTTGDVTGTDWSNTVTGTCTLGSVMKKSDACQFGFVWREATPADHVCVTSAVRQETRDENAKAAERAGANGQCKSGFVWREAEATDHVCVPVASRTRAKADDAAVLRRYQ